MSKTVNVVAAAVISASAGITSAQDARAHFPLLLSPANQSEFLQRTAISPDFKIEDAAKLSAEAVTQLCNDNGLSKEVEAVTSLQAKRYLASLCTAYFIAVVEITGSEKHWGIVAQLANRFNFDLTKDQIEPDPDIAKRFGPYIKGEIAKAYTVPLNEIKRREKILSQALSIYFTHTLQFGKKPLPSDFLVITRALKDIEFPENSLDRIMQIFPIGRRSGNLQQPQNPSFQAVPA